MRKEIKGIATIGPIIILKVPESKYFLMFVEPADAVRVSNAVHTVRNEELVFAKWMLENLGILVKQADIQEKGEDYFNSSLITDKITFYKVKPSAALTFSILTRSPFYIEDEFLLTEEEANERLSPLSIDDLVFNQLPIDYVHSLSEENKEKFKDYEEYKFEGIGPDSVIGKMMSKIFDINFVVYSSKNNLFFVSTDGSILKYETIMTAPIIDLKPEIKERYFRHDFNTVLYLLMKSRNWEVKDIFISGDGILIDSDFINEKQQHGIGVLLEEAHLLLGAEEERLIPAPISFVSSLLLVYNRNVSGKINLLEHRELKSPPSIYI